MPWKITKQLNEQTTNKGFPTCFIIIQHLFVTEFLWTKHLDSQQAKRNLKHVEALVRKPRIGFQTHPNGPLTTASETLSVSCVSVGETVPFLNIIKEADDLVLSARTPLSSGLQLPKVVSWVFFNFFSWKRELAPRGKWFSCHPRTPLKSPRDVPLKLFKTASGCRCLLTDPVNTTADSWQAKTSQQSTTACGSGRGNGWKGPAQHPDIPIKSSVCCPIMFFVLFLPTIEFPSSDGLCNEFIVEFWS